MGKYITVDKNIMSGAPVIKGTRIPVELLLIRIKQGYNIYALHHDYPHVDIKTLEGVLDEVAKSVISTYDGTPLL